MLDGDFNVKVNSDPWQVIPDQWVDLAQARWKEKSKQEKGTLDSIGCDPARGGKDRTSISKRYGMWFDNVLTIPGGDTPNGNSVAGLVVTEIKDKAPVHLDIIGIGSSVYDSLTGMGVHTIPLNSAEGSNALAKDGVLKFSNLRAEMWWKMREALDPDHGDDIALPPDEGLKIELCAPKWTLKSNGILIEAKKDIKIRIGKSTDKADSVIYANRRTLSKKKKRVVKLPEINNTSWACN